MLARPRVPAILQSERSECGLVALAMVAEAHGLEIDVPTLRSRYAISLKGATLKDLVSAAQAIDLDARALRCDIENFDELRLPAILHWRMDHFVVLVRQKAAKFIIHDPAIGRLTVSPEEMSRCFTGIVLEVWPSANFRRRTERRTLRLKEVIPTLRETSPTLLMLLVYALAIEFTQLAIPVFQQFVIDDALVSADDNLLTIIALAMAVFLVGGAATTAVRGIAQRNLTSALSIAVPSHVFRHMVRLPSAWFERRFGADVVNRFESANTIHKTLTTSLVTSGMDSIVAIVSLGIMVAYSLRLCAIVVVSMLAYGVVRSLWYSVLRSASQGLVVQNAKVQSFMWETMRGIVTLKLFGATGRRHSQYIATLSRAVRFQNNVATANTAFKFAHDLLVAAESVAVLYVGARLVLANHLSVGMLVAFLGFRNNFIDSATSVVNTAVEFKMLSIHLNRVSDILLSEREKANALPYVGEPEVRGAIELRNVSFRYGAGEADVLRGCSLRVEPREIVAIVGPSGAGKSTLLKVLSGQVEPRSGEVLIDGLAIAGADLDRLRAMIGVVRQDDVLFSGSVTDNITLFVEEPDFELARNCAARANILSEIERMPMGFNTLIGDMGSGLSGGQIQRLLLARALYKRPSILLLDEATSHLDVENEREVTLALRKLDLTQVIIAHRPDTIAQADRVIDIRDINKTGGNVVAIEAGRSGALASAAAHAMKGVK